jgi:hypothetical protein
MMTDIDYAAALLTGTHKVLFHKDDGSIRTIRGSLQAGDQIRTPGIVPIRCADTGAFKSFKVAAVIEFAKA